MKFVDLRLLTIEEAKNLSIEFLTYENWWWLQSPGHDPSHAARIDYGGLVHSNGIYVDYTSGAVRPALVCENVDDYLQVGEEYYIDVFKWLYVGEDKFLYNDDSICHCFDTKSNNYENSSIKRFLDSWKRGLAW